MVRKVSDTQSCRWQYRCDSFSRWRSITSVVSYRDLKRCWKRSTVFCRRRRAPHRRKSRGRRSLSNARRIQRSTTAWRPGCLNLCHQLTRSSYTLAMTTVCIRRLNTTNIHYSKKYRNIVSAPGTRELSIKYTQKDTK